MHFLTIVCLPPGYTGGIEDGVTAALAPFNKELEVEQVDEDGEVYWRNPQGIWDWWQIGGRYSGHLDAACDPRSDPRNWEPCIHCGGTGIRAASGIHPQTGQPWCNGCTHDLEVTHRRGMTVKWPTEWVVDSGNVARLGDVRSILERSEWPGRPYYLVHEGITSAKRYDADSEPHFVDTSQDVIDAIRKLSDDCTVVVVDVHR